MASYGRLVIKKPYLDVIWLGINSGIQPLK